MCGFLGIIDSSALAPAEIENFRNQSKKLASRGTSDQGEYSTQNAAFFHYRLAFRDLALGKQPMHNADQSIVLVYNGELYDYAELKKDLAKQYVFRTNSDTEVILAAYEKYGADLVHHIDGEYAFCIWDKKNKKILLARDPFGVKPLFFTCEELKAKPKNFFRFYQNEYHFTIKNRLYCSSEIKGLPVKLNWETEGLLRQITGLYDEMGTAFAGVIQIPPGSILLATYQNNIWNCEIQRKIPKNRMHSRVQNFDFYQQASNLRTLVGNAVKAKLHSDVPLGIYLSGGIDSQIIAHEMHKELSQFSSFTVTFPQEDYDESSSVKNFIAAHPGITGHFLQIENSALDYAYPHAVYASELIQPYTNGAAKWWLSLFTRQHVQGVLTGEGADELFCGYPSYRYLAWWNFYQRTQGKARAMLYGARLGGEQKPWEKGISSRLDGSDLLASQKQWHWIHPMFGQIKALASLFFSSEAQATTWLIDAADSVASYRNSYQRESSLLQWQNYFLHTHFPTHVLNWVGDRMEMANTLEGRPVYLTKPILTFMRQLPDYALIRGLRDKAILRTAYKTELQKFARTPKKQFNAPFITNETLCNDFLNEPFINEVGIFNQKQLTQVKKLSQQNTDPLQQSYAQMFQQNILVTQMLHRFLIMGEQPERNISFEEDYLQENKKII